MPGEFAVEINGDERIAERWRSSRHDSDCCRGEAGRWSLPTWVGGAARVASGCRSIRANPRAGAVLQLLRDELAAVWSARTTPSCDSYDRKCARGAGGSVAAAMPSIGGIWPTSGSARAFADRATKRSRDSWRLRPRRSPSLPITFASDQPHGHYPRIRCWGRGADSGCRDRASLCATLDTCDVGTARFDASRRASRRARCPGAHRGSCGLATQRGGIHGQMSAMTEGATSVRLVGAMGSGEGMLRSATSRSRWSQVMALARLKIDCNTDVQSCPRAHRFGDDGMSRRR